ncbi:MAG: tetratricopeptide repeat protein [Verrucomicrobiota bacterium]
MRYLIGLVERPTARAATLAALLWGALVVPSVGQAQNENLDPSDVWYRGFLIVQAARDLEERGKYLEALNKLNDAKPIFDQLAQAFPNYQTEMIRQRRQLNAEKRDELKTILQNGGVPPGAAPPPNPARGAQGPAGAGGYNGLPNSPGSVPRTTPPGQPYPNIPPASTLPTQPQPYPQTPSTIPAPPVGTPPGAGIPEVRVPTSPGARQRSFEVEDGDGEFALPTWGGGNNQQLPNVGTAPVPQVPQGMPRVETRSGVPSVGAIANSLYDKLAQNDMTISWLNDENRKLRTELRDREASLQELNAEMAQAQGRYNELQQQVQRREQGPGSVEAQQTIRELRGLLRDATEQLQDVTDRNARLVAELTQSRQEIAKLKDRMAALEKQRDNLAEAVEGQGNSGTALKDLMARNQELTDQLDRAQKLASSLSELNKDKDSEIAMLKSEVSKIKLERDQLVSQNQSHQQSIDDLRRQLEMLSDGLSFEEKNSLANASANPIQQHENELLRSIVLKQLRRQAQVKQAKDLLIRQLDKIGARSDMLLGLIDDMARGSQLTEEEKSLIIQPEFKEILEAATAQHEPTNVMAKVSNVGSVAFGSATFVAAGNGQGDGSLVTNGVIRNQELTVELAQIEKAARLDFSEGRLNEAEKGFLEYLRYRPRNVPCLCNLAILNLSMKNYASAENYLERALAVDDRSGLAHYLLGRALFLQGKLEDALASLERAISHDPQNAKAHNCVGVISSQKGWVSRAERAFTNAVSIDPSYGDAHFNLAVLYATRDQPDPKGADKHYFRALELGVPRDAAIEGFLDEFAKAGNALGMR